MQTNPSALQLHAIDWHRMLGQEEPTADYSTNIGGRKHIAVDSVPVPRSALRHVMDGIVKI